MKIHTILFGPLPLGRRGPMKLLLPVGQYVSWAIQSFTQKELIGFF